MGKRRHQYFLKAMTGQDQAVPFYFFIFFSVQVLSVQLK